MRHETKPTDTGLNRTGLGTSPMDKDKVVEGAKLQAPQASFAVDAIEAVRTSFSREAEPLGTLPPPATLKGAAKTLVHKLQGEKANVLIDLVGERLAFERTGTRLYEALLAKLAAAGDHPSGPTRADLEQIRDEELAHAAMLAEAATEMGADPTAMTPAADVTAVASSGIVKVVCDPRTTLTQALNAMLVAELADNDGWAMLTELAERLDQDAFAQRCHAAAQDEERHLDLVRSWLQGAIEGQAGLPADGHAAAPPPPPAGAE